MSASNSVPVASCFQAMPAGTVPTCASMSVSLGVPVNTVNTLEQMGGVTSAGHVRNGTCIESAAVCGNGMEQVRNVFASGNGETYSFDGDLNLLPKYDGAKKGLAARLWLKSMEKVWTLYRLKEKQMVPLTRFLCTGLAREWTGIQPDDQSWEQFKDAFLNEWGRVNEERVFIEMLNHHQGTASVGEYAVTMQRYFLQLDITPQRQKDYFVKNLRMGLRESVFASRPETLSAAIESAHEAERMFSSLSRDRRDMGREVQHLGKEVAQLFSMQRSSQHKRASDRRKAHDSFAGEEVQQARMVKRRTPPRCLCCDDKGHTFYDFKNTPKFSLNTCCRYWRKHRSNCPQGKAYVQKEDNFHKADIETSSLSLAWFAEDADAASGDAHLWEEPGFTDKQKTQIQSLTGIACRNIRKVRRKVRPELINSSLCRRKI
jgi:hypothetical protein